MPPLLFPVPEDGRIDWRKQESPVLCPKSRIDCEGEQASPPGQGVDPSLSYSRFGFLSLQGVPLANPKARLEASTSRPLLLYAISIKCA
jgi:hypothetical protein